ncbi:uncharacterized [Tachysurus ichikawai]
MFYKHNTLKEYPPAGARSFLTVICRMSPAGLYLSWNLFCSSFTPVVQHAVTVMPHSPGNDATQPGLSLPSFLIGAEKTCCTLTARSLDSDGRCGLSEPWGVLLKPISISPWNRFWD